MAILGSSALLFALVLTIANFSVGAIALRQLATSTQGRLSPEQLAKIARRAGMISFAAVSIAVFALIYAMFVNDFSLAYVVHESNRALPTPYKFAALWSGQEGSLLPLAHRFLCVMPGQLNWTLSEEPHPYFPLAGL